MLLGTASLALLAGSAAANRAGELAIDALDGVLPVLFPVLPASPMSVVNLIGDETPWVVLMLLTALTVARWSWRDAGQVLVVAASGEALALLLKIAVDRARPPAVALEDAASAAFPSGHVTRAGLIVGVLMVGIPWCASHPRITIGIGLVAVGTMGLARVAARAHHTSDVLGGLMLASVVVGAWALVRARPGLDPGLGGDGRLE